MSPADEDPDSTPAGDPRDPRGDPGRTRHSRRGRVRRFPRWSLVLLVALVVAAFAGQGRLLLAEPAATLDALAFAALFAVPLVAALLWADRRWPPGRRSGEDQGDNQR